MGDDARLRMGASEELDPTKIMGPSSVDRMGKMGAAAAPALARIGHYRILRPLGEGGMGIVYEAEQEQPRRIVALKVIKPGLATPERLWRFEHESEALGRLQHPGIAQIYEAGTADTGFGPQPYFAMELIQGHSLRRYAEKHQLSTRQRLELVRKICEGVHHAHQRGLIHRDLKPGNILVDETGQPKILDFGVARLTDSDAPATRQTDLGQLVGTLAYMSPEQVLADPLELDTRSDVYSLGVVLYELLSGRLPHDVDHRKLPEAVRMIREEDPTALSSISRHYRGDVETIVGKALEKDKERRYGSAAGMAADIQRYLNDEPITARPPSLSYQLQKFARRHRALVAGVAAVFVVLAGGIVASTWQAIRANRAGQAALVQRDRAAAAEQTATRERDRALSAEQAATSDRNKAVAAQAQAVREQNRAVAERQRADDQAATAKAVNDFLQNDLLAQAGASTQAAPNTKPDPDLKVRTALDRAAARIEGKFDKQPAVEASIRLTMGDTYKDLGLFPEAQRQEQRALDLRRRVLGEEHPDTLSSMNNVAELYSDRGQYAEAEALYAKVLEVRRRVLGEEHPDTLDSTNNLAVLYRREGKYAQAESPLINVLEVRRRALGDEHPDTLNSMNSLAGVYSSQGKYAQAEPLLTKVLEVRRHVLGEEHPDTLVSGNNLAALYYRQGKYVQAEPLFTKVLEVRHRVLGEEHPDTLSSMNNLALLYSNQGKYAQAEPLLTKVLEIRRRVLGEEHPNTLVSINSVAFLYSSQEKYAQAEPLLTKLLEIQRRTLGEDHPNTLISMNNLGAVYQQQEKYAQAEPLLTKVLEIQRRTLGEEHPNTLSSMSNLALLYSSQRKYAQAEPLVTKALEIQRRTLGEEHPDALNSLSNLGVLHWQQEKYGQAEPLLTKVLEIRSRTLGEQHPNTLSSMNNLAGLYQSQRKYTQAEALLSKVLEVRRRVLGPQHPDTTDVMASLGEVRLLQQKFADAEPLLREALTSQEKSTPDKWGRYLSQNLLGGSLTGQKKYGEAEALLVSGYQGMIQREARIPTARRPELKEAGERIVQLYESWGKPEKAAEWREKLRIK